MGILPGARLELWNFVAGGAMDDFGDVAADSDLARVVRSKSALVTLRVGYLNEHFAGQPG
jgi:hypothetical protein